MKEPKFKKTQSGLALLAAVLIIVIFTIMGMMNAKQAKESEKMAGGNVRYESVFQAAELSLRNSVEYINHADGTLQTGYAGSGSTGRANAENFDMSGLEANRPIILYDPENAIVWDREKLQETICGAGECTSGIDFMSRLDRSFWEEHGIISSFDNNSDDKNYIRNIETYVFIQYLSSISGGAGGGDVIAIGSDFHPDGKSNGKEIFYLITVKASGFPPGTDKDNKDPLDARENVVLQAVFAKRV